MEPSATVGCLWFLVIGYMFFAQHHTCDAYFVPAINVFCDKMSRSKNKWLQRWGEEAVAGATICALGCNGPEMFSNLISLYTGSDAGIGVVVGSEIFNLLCIVGGTALASPIRPVSIEKVPFTRDVLFYALSIGLLYWVLQDKQVTWFECRLLLGAAVVYVAAVYFTSDIANCFFPGPKDLKTALLPASSNTTPRGIMHGVPVEVVEMVHSRMADSKKRSAKKWKLDPTAQGIVAEGGKTPRAAEDARTPRMKKGHGLGFEFERPDAILGPVLKYRDLKEVVLMGGGVIQLEFHHDFRHVTLKCTCADAEQRDILLHNIEKHSLGRPWVHGYDATVGGAFKHMCHELCSKENGFLSKIWAPFEFIIDGVLKATLFAVDVKDSRKEGRWPLCFMLAMMWLAIFSYFMIAVAEQIHYNLPWMPSAFLGITVCAIGTSFPNLVASVIMAQQSKPAAAIANALGSNVQNVFLAMALPWCIFCAQANNFAPIPQNVQGITEGVYWMMGTLVLLLIFVFAPTTCALSRVEGIILIMVYFGYLVLTSGEFFGWWPALVQ